MEDPSLLDSHLARVSFSSGGSSTTVIALATWDAPILELRISGRFLTICTPDGSAPGTAPYRFLEALIFSFARFDRSTERLLFMSVQLSLPTIARFATLAMLDASFSSLPDNSDLSLCSDVLGARFGPLLPSHSWFVLTSADFISTLSTPRSTLYLSCVLNCFLHSESAGLPTGRMLALCTIHAAECSLPAKRARATSRPLSIS
jgi:hypothetical protein